MEGLREAMVTTMKCVVRPLGFGGGSHFFHNPLCCVRKDRTHFRASGFRRRKSRDIWPRKLAMGAKPASDAQIHSNCPARARAQGRGQRMETRPAPEGCVWPPIVLSILQFREFPRAAWERHWTP